MKTFREFLSEGKKKREKKERKYVEKLTNRLIKNANNQVAQQRAAGQIPIVTYPDSDPHSPERSATFNAFLARKKKWMRQLKQQSKEAMKQFRDNPEQFRRDNPDYPNYPQS